MDPISIAGLLTAAGIGAAGTLGSKAIDWATSPSQPQQQPNPMQPGRPSTQQTGNAFTGYGAQTQQLSRYNPTQEKIIESYLPQLLSQLQQNKTDFAPIAQQARNQYNQVTAPSLAQRFFGMGNNRNSSGFEGKILQSGQGLETALAALESQHNLGRQGQLQGLLGTLLQPSYENIYIPQTSGFAGNLAEGFGRSAPNLVDLLNTLLKGYQMSKGGQSDSSGSQDSMMRNQEQLQLGGAQ